MNKPIDISKTAMFICALIILFATSSYAEESVSCNKKLVEDGFSFFEVTEKKGMRKTYAYISGTCFKPDHYEKTYGNFRQISKKQYCKNYKYNNDEVRFRLSLKTGLLPCREPETKVDKTGPILEVASTLDLHHYLNSDDWKLFCELYPIEPSNNDIYGYPGCTAGFKKVFNLYFNASGRKAWFATTVDGVVNGEHYGVSWGKTSYKDALDEARKKCNEWKGVSIGKEKCTLIVSDNLVVHPNTVSQVKRLIADKLRENNQTTAQTAQVDTSVVQVSESKIDKEAPVLKIDERITVNEMDYSISGRVEDASEVFIEVDGNSIIVSDNKFQIKGSTPIGLNEIEVVAFDQWGNKISKNIIIERVMQTVEGSHQFEELNPYKLKSKTSKNKLALIIGIEEYESIPNANFADRDAQFFIDYVQRGFGVPENKIKFFFNENAKERSKFEMIKWLKQNITNNTEVYLYFSGHGLAINEGRELYLLANDTITDFIEETAINRNEIFNAIAANNPKSVTAFLDTCYSGAGRADDQMLLAMAKGLVVVDEQQKKLPDNFTLFTAASAQESAWSLPEAQHGTFSYFLMKGMEGNADLNGDKKLTNGELRDYLLDNVGRYAQQQQTPQMVGDPNQVLIKF